MFSLALVYFAFVYYPKAVDQYKDAVLPQKPFFPPVVAKNEAFPIETEAYRIVFEESADTYYVFVAGKTLDVYMDNKHAADLALKNALNEMSLCNYAVIYTPTEKLNVPQKYQTRPGC